ncbi:MAG: hypothetical protein JWO73_290 [Candidatus Taylorbacteria bacterium]|nr:hypothetical protein [Candidatus Taylorbacteria bacterium]
MKTNRGFTLIELLVVISIVSLLSSIVLASLTSARAKSRDTQRMRNFHEIQTALQLYATDNGGKFPDSSAILLDDFIDSVDVAHPGGWSTLKTQLGRYIRKLPVDPMNNGRWSDAVGNYSYSYYYNVNTDSDYDLVAKLENASSPYRATVRHYSRHSSVLPGSSVLWESVLPSAGSNLLYSDH